MEVGWPPSRTYLIGSILNWGLFLAGIGLLAWGGGTGRLPVAVAWAVALLLAGSVAGQFVAAYRLIARQDEFVRAIAVKRIVVGTGLTLTLAVLYGIAEQFLGAPRVPLWVVYPFFWGSLGVVTPFIREDTRP